MKVTSTCHTNLAFFRLKIENLFVVVSLILFSLKVIITLIYNEQMKITPRQIFDF